MRPCPPIHDQSATRTQLQRWLCAALCACLVACGVASEQGPTRAHEAPNVILILADDAGLGNFSCYGNRQLQTPNVDRLAREGMRFTQHYAGSPFCAPTRCTLLTGKHTGASTVRGNNLLKLGKGETTLAEIFQAQGYATACIGKWGLGDGNSGEEPLAHGFDTYIGFTNEQLFAERYFPEFILSNGKAQHLPGNSKGGRGSYAPDFLLQASLDYLQAHRDEPFFLYLPFLLPHAPFETTEQGRTRAALALPNLERDSVELTYAAMIQSIDAHVGRILDKLVELQLDQRTLVIFSSDNGASADGINPGVLDSNLGQRGYKGQLFEGGIRAPLLVRWPGRVAPGSTSAHPSAFWDHMATLAELIGAELPEQSTGVSFLPTLLGETQRQLQPEYLYWELSEPNLPNRPRGIQAARVGNWKALRLDVTGQADAPMMLFDLVLDPHESQDVAAQHPELVASMAALMSRAHSTNKRFPLLPAEAAEFGDGAWKGLRFQ